ncbi:hypothetical protein HBH88_231400 [Parastagonospora nodorum]|nr:hypothetical protein HBH88_231400 [Parastagonospora nodorum]
MDPSDNIMKLHTKDMASPINVHQGLLGKSSEFFKRAMKPEWASLREDPDTIDLTDELSGPVLLYVRWLYSGELQVDIPAFRKGGAEENRTASEQAYKKLASAYLFGEMVMDVSFKNAIIPKFIETKTRFKIPTHPYIVDELYSGTTDSSPIRRLLADIIACGCDPREPTWAEYLKAIPHQAVIDSMMALAALQDPLTRNRFRECQRECFPHMSPIPDLHDTASATVNSQCNLVQSQHHSTLDCYSPLLPIYPSSFLHQKSLTIPLCQRDSPLKT